MLRPSMRLVLEEIRLMEARIGQLEQQLSALAKESPACQVLLSRWSGQRDVVLGTVVSGRDRAEVEGLVGFFVNTVVLRSTVDDDRSFIEFLARVREMVLDAFAVHGLVSVARKQGGDWVALRLESR